MIAYNESLGQYFQVGMVSGGISECGNPDIPDYYVRLDHPEISGFIRDPDHYSFGDPENYKSGASSIFLDRQSMT